MAQWVSGLRMRETGSRVAWHSGQQRAGQVMTVFVAQTLDPSCHSGSMSREGFYL